MKPRKDLSDIFHNLCSNVYYQPPTGAKLKYPCIVYTFDNLHKTHADNFGYLMSIKYSVTYMTRDPDDMTKIRIAEIPMSSLDRSSNNDNIYHYYYTIYQ